MVSVSKDGVNFFEIEDSGDELETARSKGYKPYISVSKGDQTFQIEDSREEIDTAIEKGYTLQGPSIVSPTMRESLTGMAASAADSVLGGFGKTVAAHGSAALSEVGELFGLVPEMDYSDRVEKEKSDITRQMANLESLAPTATGIGTGAGFATSLGISGPALGIGGKVASKAAPVVSKVAKPVFDKATKVALKKADTIISKLPGAVAPATKGSLKGVGAIGERVINFIESIHLGLKNEPEKFMSEIVSTFGWDVAIGVLPQYAKSIGVPSELADLISIYGAFSGMGHLEKYSEKAVNKAFSQAGGSITKKSTQQRLIREGVSKDSIRRAVDAFAPKNKDINSKLAALKESRKVLEEAGWASFAKAQYKRK